MKAKQLINYLSSYPDDYKILIYVEKTGETRELHMKDLDNDVKMQSLIIDAEYRKGGNNGSN